MKEDCISRQAVDELSKELVHTTRDKADFLCNFWEGLQKLPSVASKEKIGHCKDCKYRDYWGECNKWAKELDAHRTYLLDENGYCFLFEPQESEDKE